MILLEKRAVIEKNNQVRLPLNHNRKVRVRNEQMLSNMQHSAAHIVHAHDQLRCRLQLPRNLRQYVPRFHHVLDLFRRGMAR